MKKFTASIGDKPITVYYITDKEEASKIMKFLSMYDGAFLGLDIETAMVPPAGYVYDKKAPQPGLCPHMSFVRLIQIYNGAAVYVFDNAYLQGEIDFTPIKDKRFIAHNGVFEIKHLTKLLGYKLQIECSMLMGMLIDRADTSPYEPDEEEDEARSDFKGYSLWAMTGKYLDYRLDKNWQVSDWSAVKLDDGQLVYAALDAVCTYELGHIFSPQLSRRNMGKIYKLLSETQHAIAFMETVGFPVNIIKHEKLMETWNNERDRTSKRCSEFFKKHGSSAPINCNSPKQLGEWLDGNEDIRTEEKKAWPTTETGRYSFNRKALGLRVAKYPAIKALIDWKKWEKLANTYGTGMAAKIHPITRRLHCQFSLGEVRTGRLSSRNPNLQNLPRDGGVRDIFEAGDGKCFIVADYSQIEIRVAAALSGDPVMMKCYTEGIDVYKMFTGSLIKKKIDDISKDERQLGKAIVLGLQFGMGGAKLAEHITLDYGIHTSEDKGWEYWNHYHQFFNVFSKWCGRMREKAEETGIAVTPMGKIRKLAETEVYTKAVNTPVQGGAAEIIMNALCKVHAVGLTIANTVHDEIIVECNDNIARIKEATMVLEDKMIEAATDIIPNLPTKNLVEAHSGKTWEEAK